MKYVIPVLLIVLCGTVRAELLGVKYAELPRSYHFTYQADEHVKSMTKEEIIREFKGVDLINASAVEVKEHGSYSDLSQDLIIEYSFPYPVDKPKIHTLIQRDKAYWINSMEVGVKLRVGFDNEAPAFLGNREGVEKYKMEVQVKGIVTEPISNGGIVITSKDRHSAADHKFPIWRGAIDTDKSKFRYVKLENEKINIIENDEIALSVRIYVDNPKLVGVNYWELPSKDTYLIVSYFGQARPGLCWFNDVAYKVSNVNGVTSYVEVGRGCQGRYGPH